MPFSTQIRESRAFVAEVKFLVPADRVDDLRAWARSRLRPDPFGGGPFGDSYETSSLYFDTGAFDVFRRHGSYGRSKYRIRRYGNEPELFLERKLKTRELVTKRRSRIAADELSGLLSADPRKGWAGHWFHRRILARNLGPVCQVAYSRTALVQSNGHGPIRLTLDTGLRGAPAGDLAFADLGAAVPLTGACGILELKFYCVRPPLFDELIGHFALTPQPLSKYRAAVQALYAREVAIA